MMTLRMVRKIGQIEGIMRFWKVMENMILITIVLVATMETTCNRLELGILGRGPPIKGNRMQPLRNTGTISSSIVDRGVTVMCQCRLHSFDYLHSFKVSSLRDNAMKVMARGIKTSCGGGPSNSGPCRKDEQQVNSIDIA
jgi:hypothetical protein